MLPNSCFMLLSKSYAEINNTQPFSHVACKTHSGNHFLTNPENIVVQNEIETRKNPTAAMKIIRKLSQLHFCKTMHTYFNDKYTTVLLCYVVLSMFELFFVCSSKFFTTSTKSSWIPYATTGYLRMSAAIPK